MQKPEIAGFWRRLAAMGYDALLVFALLFGATAAYQLIANWISPSESTAALATGDVIHGIEPAAAGPLYSIYLLLVWAGFFIWFWRKSGQTLGMQAWRIRIDAEEGGRISLGRACLRYVAAWLSALCLGLGYLWILVDREKRSWHDIGSHSRVVLLPKKEKQKPTA